MKSRDLLRVCYALAIILRNDLFDINILSTDSIYKICS